MNPRQTVCQSLLITGEQNIGWNVDGDKEKSKFHKGIAKNKTIFSTQDHK